MKIFWNTLQNDADTAVVPTKKCDFPGCSNRGEYKAPKSRYDLSEYYWFCLEHVQQYNQNWDFFKGMSQDEIEIHLMNNIVGDRPTWKASEPGVSTEKIRKKIYKTYARNENIFQDFGISDDDFKAGTVPENILPNTAVEALKVMDLYPPISWQDIKLTYRTLAKKYHPDKTQGNTKAEEKLKQINLAYSILKLTYQTLDKFQK